MLGPLVRGFEEEKKWRRISLSQFAARLNREVEGILASRFSQSEQLDGMFVCSVTGHSKVLLQYFRGIFKHIQLSAGGGCCCNSPSF